MKTYLSARPFRRGSPVIHFIKSEKGTSERTYWLGTYHDLMPLGKRKPPYSGEGWEYNQCHSHRITREAYLALREDALMWNIKARIATNRRRNGQ
jgi:hypothetical protein